MLADEVCLLLVVISLAMRGVNGHGNFEELLGSMAETRSEPLPRTPHRVHANASAGDATSEG
jgi:hypothetical protein